MRTCLLLLPMMLTAPAVHAAFTAHVGLGAVESSGGSEPLGLQGEDGFRDSDFGYMIGGGYRFNRHFKLDLTWMRLDSGLSFDETLYEVFTFGGHVADQPLDMRGSGVRLAVEAQYPIEGEDPFALFVRGGYWRWDVELGRSGQRESFTGTDPVLGAGMRFGAVDEVHMDLSFDVHRMDDVDVNWLYLQINFPLGQ